MGALRAGQGQAQLHETENNSQKEKEAYGTDEASIPQTESERSFICSASLCLLGGTFSPFTFKLIIHIIVTLLLVLWLFYSSLGLASLVLFPCDLMAFFNIMLIFLFLYFLYICYRFLSCGYQETHI